MTGEAATKTSGTRPETAGGSGDLGEPGTIRVRGLTRRFGQLTAVRPFELDVGPGGVTGLLGPNGAGKSTLLRMLLGLVRPSAGSACVDGTALRGDGTSIRRRVAYAPGEIAVYGELNAEQHIAWQLRGRGRAALSRALELAAGFDLPLSRRVRGFSHGMKRQLFVAVAMAPDVRIRILDEPTEGLDPTRRRQVLDLLTLDAERGTTILLSSHHLGEIGRVCDRLLFMRQGELLDEGHTQELHARSLRAVRIAWNHAVDTEAVRNALAGFADVRVEARRAVIYFGDMEPRKAIASIVALDALPPPTSLTYGELTIQDLYGELYGVEGL